MEIEQALMLANNLLVQQGLRPLTDVETLIVRGAWEQKTYEAIAQTTSYSSSYLRKDVGPKLWRDLSVALGEPVSKTNFKAALERRSLLNPPSLSTQASSSNKQDAHPKADWGEAIDVSTFLGRVQEQAILTQWVTTDRCRFVLLLGMGGIGKTAISIKIGQLVESDFEFVIWRSLRNAPPLLELLADVIKFLTGHPDIEPPTNIDTAISWLLQSLRNHRCLLILDNAETILQAGDRNGRYQPGYESYGQLFQQIGETLHQSCLMVTSRERPQDLAPKFGQQLPMRCLTVGGLTHQDGQALFSRIGQFSGTALEWQFIIKRYDGNPLALKIVASFVNEVFAGDLSQLLSSLGQSSYILEDIRALLDQQFQRLSPQEQEVMTWLAIRREPVALQELLEDLVQPMQPHHVLQILASLQGRSLIEKVENHLFTQQPVVMEYTTNGFIEQMSQQFCHWQVGDAIDSSSLLQKYALIQVQAKDYVKETQVRLILQPVLDHLMHHFGEVANIEKHLQQMLQEMRADPTRAKGYAAGNLINVLRHLDADLAGYNFSQLTVWQADLQGITLHDVDFSRADLAKSRFSQTFGWITAIAFSPDGEYWAVGDAIGVLYVWSRHSEQYHISLKAHQSMIRSIAFSPDGQRLLSGSFDGTIQLWDVKTGNCLLTLNAHNEGVWSVTFAKNGDRFASGGADGTVKVWDCQTGQCLQTLANQSPVRSIVFTADQRYLVSGSVDCQIRLWDVDQGQCVRTFAGHSDIVWSVNISPDGQSIVSGSNDRMIKLWDLQSGVCLHNFEGHTLQIWSVAISPDGRTIASGSLDQTVRLWDIQTKQCTACFRGHTNIVVSVAFSPDGRTLMSGGIDQMIKQWDLTSKTCSRSWLGYKNIIWSVAFSPDGRTIANSSLDGMIRIWQAADCQCIHTLKHLPQVRAIALSPDGRQLVSGNIHPHSTLKVWDVQNATCLATIPAHIGGVVAACFDPSGSLVATVGDDKNVQIYHLKHQRVEKILQGHQAMVWSICFSPDGQWLASGSFDQTVRIWDVNSGNCVHILSGHTDAVTALVFHPALPLIATASGDSMVRLWSLETGECDLILREHQSFVIGIAFSPDGQTCATGSYDMTIRLWDVATWQCRAILQPNSLVHSLAFSPDSQTLVSGGDNGTLQLWDLATQTCIKVLQLPEIYGGMNIRGVRGLTEAQQAMLLSLGAVVQ